MLEWHEACLAKSPAQISAALCRLIEDEYIVTSIRCVPGKAPPGDSCIYPTDAALRTVPAFARMPGDELAREIEKLHVQ